MMNMNVQVDTLRGIFVSNAGGSMLSRSVRLAESWCELQLEGFILTCKELGIMTFQILQRPYVVTTCASPVKALLLSGAAAGYVTYDL
jgi:hypothetical protein